MKESIMDMNKNDSKEYFSRVKNDLKTQIDSRTLRERINTRVVSIVMDFEASLNWTKDELGNLDDKTIVRIVYNADRLFVKRK